MRNAGQHNPFRRPVAAQFVSNDHPRSAPGGPQQLAEEPDGSKSIPSRLDENIQDNTVLIDRSPEIACDSVDLEKDLILSAKSGCGGECCKSGDPGCSWTHPIDPVHDSFEVDCCGGDGMLQARLGQATIAGATQTQGSYSLR